MEQTKKYIHESVRLLKEMIAIPSLSFHEDEVCSHICSFLDSCGIIHYREKNNIIALNRHFDPTHKSLMLNAHIDTVPPGTEYSFDPYEPDYSAAAETIPADPAKKGAVSHEYPETGHGFICGLGSNDDGASVVSMIAAFRHFYDERLPVNLILVLSSEEERSGKNGMDRIWLRFPTIIAEAFHLMTPAGNPEFYIHEGRSESCRYPQWAIVGEPTGMAAATSERGLLVIDAVAEGVSGHAARNEGINAIDIAVDDITKLHGHVFHKVSTSMGQVNMNVTQINAGSAHNVIPDRCEFVIDIRPTERYSNKEILNELQSICKSRLTARNLHNRSSATPAKSPLLECIKSMGISTFSSPTTSDWMRINCEAIKMGPGDSRRSHKKDEFVYISEIENAVGTYIEFIKRFCNNY